MSDAPPFAPVALPFFDEMVSVLGTLQRAAFQRRWLETPASSRVTMVLFFAPWCASCVRVAPAVRDLEARHPSADLGILGVSEYAAPAETEAFRKLHGLRHLFVFESMHRDAREDEGLWHRRAKAAAGDGREWGLPLFLLRVRETGKAFACAGEPSADGLSRFLSERLSGV